MYERLKTRYAHAFAETESIAREHRLTLQLPDGSECTLDRRELNEAEIAVLSQLFDENVPSDVIDVGDQSMYNWLKNSQEPPASINAYFPLRFVYIHIPAGKNDMNGAEEALPEIFPGTVSLFWLSAQDGVLIQTIDEEFDETPSLASVVDTLASDLYTKSAICAGSPVSSMREMYDRFQLEIHLYETIKPWFNKKAAFSEQEMTLFYLIKFIPEHSLQTSMGWIRDVKNDPSLTDSVRTYLQSNLNISSAAKQQFMHRNTMQYRVDKFIEKTGIDIKQFPNAAVVYILLSVLDLQKHDHD
ncbi:PucR family transcriptional regulator [Salisediminibacterium halotolerans]|uniref:PucR family transcriptional regulator n=1 Tax=Salisediminibacterium halotolerans TaxID=517425 RepID=UPI000EAB959F|nr:helix-turn-helix domain-containing protein [Salisediminibacterium halotolerans]RLJ72380.1 PucR-like helix-turn-helix protein [Actinophytocola xinjiangensis]RPE85595.1 PucR-like helix-turn-helix protein [Salisediminibacterium halotolerans]TWG33549.1 PucR-like helix-turn-helix protein [Salisediminibacterium halotolerans]GEL08705.1 hypothetical protein SHA02_21210 [Salisediminibacterium halotolerans]